MMNTETRKKDCYETLTGVPTLTIVSRECERMIPWHSFVSGQMKADTIELQFQNWKLRVKGEQLAPLWDTLQLQDVRLLQLVTREEYREGDSFLSLLEMEAIGED